LGGGGGYTIPVCCRYVVMCVQRSNVIEFALILQKDSIFSGWS
jgi:hypothetical protein